MTHRFHPLAGRDFEFVAHRHNWGEDRVHLHDENGELFSLPQGGPTSRPPIRSWSSRMAGAAVEAWRQAGILTPASARRRRHEVTTDSLVRLHALLDELRRMGKDRELRDYVWSSAQDTADYADGMLAEALRQPHSGELSEEYAPSEKDLAWARRALDGSSPGEGH